MAADHIAGRILRARMVEVEGKSGGIRSFGQAHNNELCTELECDEIKLKQYGVLVFLPTCIDGM